MIKSYEEQCSACLLLASPAILASLVPCWRADLLARETRLPDMAPLSLLRECLRPTIPGICKKLIPDVRDAMLSDDMLPRQFCPTKNNAHDT